MGRVVAAAAYKWPAQAALVSFVIDCAHERPGRLDGGNARRLQLVHSIDGRQGDGR
jgi:hypothetical protein